MTLDEAKAEAKVKAEAIGCSVLVYKSTLHPDREEYGTCFTLPTFGESIERIYPEQETIVI